MKQPDEARTILHRSRATPRSPPNSSRKSISRSLLLRPRRPDRPGRQGARCLSRQACGRSAGRHLSYEIASSSSSARTTKARSTGPAQPQRFPQRQVRATRSPSRPTRSTTSVAATRRQGHRRFPQGQPHQPRRQPDVPHQGPPPRPRAISPPRSPITSRSATTPPPPELQSASAAGYIAILLTTTSCITHFQVAVVARARVCHYGLIACSNTALAASSPRPRAP